MTLTELLGILNGEYKEIAGTTARNQCVDLANTYIRYVLKLPVIEHTNAKDFPSRINPADYEYILNTLLNVPKEGDLMIWDGTYGHIAIFIEGDANRFTSFDQNYPTGTPCHIQTHNYKTPKVLGWLHPKNPPSSAVQELQQCVNDRNSHWDWLIKIADKLGVTVNLDIILSEIEKFIKYEDIIREKDIELKSKSEEIASLTSRINDLTGQVETLSGQLTTALQENKDQKEKLDSASETVRLLASRIDEIKNELAAMIKQGIDGQSALNIIWLGIKKLFTGR